jgi:hypothetical protein
MGRATGIEWTKAASLLPHIIDTARDLQRFAALTIDIPVYSGNTVLVPGFGDQKRGH